MKRFNRFLVPMIMAGLLIPPVFASQASTFGSSFQGVDKIPAGKTVVYIYRPGPSGGLAGDFAADVKIPFNVK